MSKRKKMKGDEEGENALKMLGGAMGSMMQSMAPALGKVLDSSMMMRQANGNDMQPDIPDMEAAVNDMAGAMADMIDEDEESIVDSDEEVADALGNDNKVVEEELGVATKKKMSRTDFHTLQYYHNVCGCDPLNWQALIDENAPMFQKDALESINFGDYGYITDATIFAWKEAGFRFNKQAEKSLLNLSGNRYISDVGVQSLFSMLSKDINAERLLKKWKTREVKIKLDGCVRITEKTIMSLANIRDSEVSISAIGTNISSTPKLRDSTDVKADHCPILAMGGDESTLVGPHTRVFVCPQDYTLPSLAAYLTAGEDKVSTGAQFVQMSHDLNGESKAKKCQINFMEAALSDPRSAVLLSGEASCVIVPFRPDQFEAASAHITATATHFLLSNAPFSGIKSTSKMIFVGVNKDLNSELVHVGKLKNIIQGAFETLRDDWKEKLKSVCSDTTRLPSFSDHMTMSSLIGARDRINEILQDIDTHISFIHFNKDSTRKEVLQKISAAIDYHILSRPDLYMYKDKTIFDLIVSLKNEKVIKREDILHMCQAKVPKLSSAAYVDQHLKRMHNWGQLLFLSEHELSVVITDLVWFTAVLQKLATDQPHKAKEHVTALHGETKLWKETDLLQLAKQDFTETKLQLLLNVLLHHKQLLLVQPDRHDITDSKYFLLQPQNLDKAVEPKIWDQFLNSKENSKDTFVTVSRKFNVASATPITAWVSVLGEVLRYCQPLMLHRDGMAWQQGAAQMVLQADVTGEVFTCIELRAKALALPESEHDVQTYVDHVFSIFEDSVLYCLYKSGALMELDHAASFTGPRSYVSECSRHRWEQPMPAMDKARGNVEQNVHQYVSVCSFCSSCSDRGQSCEYNGIHGDKYLQCPCDTQRTCCHLCGICQRCAKQLWTYRSYLRPNMNCSQSFHAIEGKDSGDKNIQPHKCDIAMDTAVLNEVELYMMLADKPKQQSWKLEGTSHELTLLERKLFSSDPFDRFTLSLHDIPSDHVSEKPVPTYNFSTCRNVTVWPDGLVRFQLDDKLIKSYDDEEPMRGEIIAKQSLTRQQFYFEIEIVNKAEHGSLMVGVTGKDGAHEASPVAVSLVTHPSKSESGVALADTKWNEVEVRECHVVGVGVMFRDDVNNVFYSVNGKGVNYIYVDENSTPEQGKELAAEAKALLEEEDFLGGLKRMQQLKHNPDIDKNRELFPFVSFHGGDWDIRIRPSPVWNPPTEISVNQKPSNDPEPEAASLANFKIIGKGPIKAKPGDQEMLVFYEVDGNVSATVELWYPLENSTNGKPYLFKMKLTNPKMYTARPNAGVLKPGESATIDIRGASNLLDANSFGKDKFRVEILEDRKEASVKVYGSEKARPNVHSNLATNYGSSASNEFASAKIGAAWEDNTSVGLSIQKITFKTKLIHGAIPKEFDYNSFVAARYSRYIMNTKIRGIPIKNSSAKGKAGAVASVAQDGSFPRGTEWDGEIDQDQPQILVRLEKNGLPVFVDQIPKEHYHLVVEGFGDPPHAPPLKNLNQVQMMKEVHNRRVLPYFMEDQFSRMIIASRMPRKNGATKLEKGHMVYIPWGKAQDDFCEKHEKDGSVNLHENLVNAVTKAKTGAVKKKKKKGKQKVMFKVEEEEGENEAGDEQTGDNKAEEADDKALQLYVPATIKKISKEKLEVEWQSEDGGTVSVEKGVIHSVYWAYHMDKFRSVEERAVYGFPMITRWQSIAGPLNYAWDYVHKSENFTIDGNKGTRGFKAQSTDGVRGNEGFTSGVHTFKFDCKSDGGWGSYGQLGVCTAEAKMHIDSYNILIGKDRHSWGWNIPTASLLHSGSRASLTPKRADTTIYMEMNLNQRYIRFYFNDDKTGFKGFEGTLPVDEPLYPCVGVVFGGSVVTIDYVASSANTDSSETDVFILKYKPTPDNSSHCYLPFDDGKNFLDGELEEKHKRLVGIYNLTGKARDCDELSHSYTVVHRRLQVVSTVEQEETEKDNCFSPFLFLPRDLTPAMLMYPLMQQLTGLDTLNVHTICAVINVPTYVVDNDSLAQIRHNVWDVTRQAMHLLNERGFECSEKLTLRNMLGMAAYSFITMATQKVLLPNSCDILLGSNPYSAKQLECGLQKALKIYASILTLNIDCNECEMLHDQKEPLMNAFVDSLPEEAGRRLRSQQHVCASHEWALHLGISEVHKDEVLNLKPALPYSRCITSVCVDLDRFPALTEIPPNFQEIFPHLKTVRVFNLHQSKQHKLAKLPSKLSGMRQLCYFDVTKTNVNALPEDIGSCPRLKYVIAKGNEIDKVPTSIEKATNLQALSLEDNKIVALPEHLMKLRELQRLAIDSNFISGLPSEIEFLSNLTVLNLKGFNYRVDQSQFPAFSQGLFDGGKKQGENKQWIERCAGVFWKHPRIGLDYVPGDEDGGISPEIFELRNLVELDLSNQAIRFVPKHIGKLKSLKVLNLEGCLLLEDLPGELGMLPTLNKINVTHCPTLRTPPREITARGVSAIKAYLRRLIGGTTENWRTKLMCVGLGGAGKTSLIKALMSKSHKTVGTSDSEVTDGIDIQMWKCMNENGKEITYSTWDFAGQDIYYNTHQFFLSGRAVYLLLWTCRLGYQHAGLDFWLSSIQCHAPKAPIFVVGTHVDIVPKAEIPEIAFLKKYPQIKGFFMVSSLKGINIAELQNAILRETTKETYMGESVPTVYLNFEQEIINMRKKNSVVPYSEVHDKAINCGISEEKDINRALVFLHDLGTIQFFDNEFLRDNVVINPQWIVDVMACVVSIKDSPIVAGRFEHAKDKATVWEKFPVALHEWLLRLTEEFDLTFPISPSVNLVPCLLPQAEPKFDWPQIKDNQRETMMLYRFGYLPAGLFNRSQVRLFQYSNADIIWKNGSVLKKNDHLALIKEINNKELMVRVQGPRPENIMFLVHEVIESLIAEFFFGVTYDFLLPCPDCLKRGIPSELGMFEASLIRTARKLNTPFLQCRQEFHTISMSRLQASMPPENNSVEFDLHLAQSMKALDDLRHSMSTDIFIAVCERDLQTGEQDITSVHPMTIVQFLKSLPYKCWYKGSVSMASMHDTTIGVQDSKLMLVFISQAFKEDKECVNLFLHAKNAMDKNWQVVCVGPNLDWRQDPIGMEIGSHHRYINMTDKSRYNSKRQELEELVKMKLTSNTTSSEPPLCFISYAWSNSHDAAKKGSSIEPGSLGAWDKGDPRKLKEYLTSNGIPCWIDIEQTGKAGLFEDIYHGIRDAEVVVICMSIQYAKSKNCMMELRFAEVTLNKPIVAVLVGQGEGYKDTEMMALISRSSAPVINLQAKDEDVLSTLLQEVKKAIPKVPRVKREHFQKAPTALEELNTVSFHEEFELAQRKFLRHLSALSDRDMMPYPRFLLLDFTEAAASEPLNREASVVSARPKSARDRPGLRKRLTIEERSVALHHGVEGYDDSWLNQNFCVRILCEHDVGCHCTETPILLENLSHHDKEQLVRNSATFLLRMYALVKHSEIKLNVNSNPNGKHYRTYLRHSVDELNMDIGQSYANLREFVTDIDFDQKMTGLNRCYMATGQIRWLCPEHQKEQRVTVINDITQGPRVKLPDMSVDEAIKAEVDQKSDMAHAYIKKRANPQPRKLPAWESDLQLMARALVEPTSPQASNPNQPNFPASGNQQPAVVVPPPLAAGQNNRERPSIHKRQSILGGAKRPASSSTKQKMRTSGNAFGANANNPESQACVIL